MSYIPSATTSNNSPFGLVTISASSVDHPNTPNKTWLSYNSGTITASTKCYWATNITPIGAIYKGIGVYTHNQTNLLDKHLQGIVFVAGDGSVGGASYGRCDDTAYTVATSIKNEWLYREASPLSGSAAFSGYDTEKSRTLVRRLK